MGGRGDLWKMGWPEINLCIKCDEGQNLLVCTETDCLLAVHEKCMGCPARFDDMGNFYCPHCFHREAVRESRRSWENAMLKKKALSIFEMASNKTNLEEKKRAEAKGHNQSEGDEDVNMAAFHVGKSAQGSDVPHQSVGTGKDAQGSIHGERTANFSPLTGANESRIAHKSDTIKRSENSNGIVGDMEHVVAHGKYVPCGEADGPPRQDQMLDKMENEEPVDSHKLNKIIGNNEKKAFTKASVQVQPSISSSRQLDNINMQEEHKINNVEDSFQEEVSQSSSGTSSDEIPLIVRAGSKRRLKKNDSSDVDSETISMRNKCRTRSNKNKKELQSQKKNPARRSSLALRNIKEFDEQIDSSRRSNQSLQLPVDTATALSVGGKRRRLMWREEEEEMLKEGVQKFSSTEQNVPWRKILEFGRHIFDETRTPVDLKDKWRNLVRR